MKTKNKFGKSIMSQMTITLFLSLLLALLLIILLLIYFIRIEGWKVLPPDETINVKISPFTRMIIFLLIVFIISAVVSINLGRRFVKPISELKNMTSEVAKGNFEVKIKDEDIPNNEVGEFMENFNTMVDELKKNEILKTDFISNVSHEFKTPLAVIQGYATLLQDDNITEEERSKIYWAIGDKQIGDKRILGDSINKIVRARVIELLEFLREDVSEFLIEDGISEIVLTGGTSNLGGICDLTSEIFSRPCTKGRFSEELPKDLRMQSWATTIGILEHIRMREQKAKKQTGLLNKIKGIFF